MTKSCANVSDVVSWRLCLGCGACVLACPQGALSLVNVEDDGLRPARDRDKCEQCGACLKVCPGLGIDAPEAAVEAIPSLQGAWGNVLEIWEGYAADPEIRFLGSSGGIATALSLFCLEKGGLAGVLHVGSEARRPLVNGPVISRCRGDLVRRAGSRYAPAAPCTGLNLLKADPARYLFVGKPCDVVALRKWQDLMPEEGRAVEAAISIFCAGTPSTLGSKRILEKLGLDPSAVTSLRYRGCGWPGRTVAGTAAHAGDSTPGARDEHSMSYQEAWGDILSRHTQFRCRLCPDSTGELADISCGDPWYRDIEPGDPGRSLVLVRTPRGRTLLHEAMETGFVRLEPADPEILPRSQVSLLARRRALWGRLAAFRTCRVPVPCFRGFSLFADWRQLSLRDRLRSLFGTFCRIRQRHWNKPRKNP